MDWKINFVERMKSNGFILQVVWECSSEQNGFVGRLTDTLGFEVKDPQVPFEQVTEPMIVDWIKNKLGPHKVLEVEKTVQAMIEANIANTKAAGAPWETALT
jgi:hypothetical protein